MYEIWLQRFLVVLHSFLKPEVYESKVVEVVRFRSHHVSPGKYQTWYNGPSRGNTGEGPMPTVSL